MPSQEKLPLPNSRFSHALRPPPKYWRTFASYEFIGTPWNQGVQPGRDCWGSNVSSNSTLTILDTAEGEHQVRPFSRGSHGLRATSTLPWAWMWIAQGTRPLTQQGTRGWKRKDFLTLQSPEEIFFQAKNLCHGLCVGHYQAQVLVREFRLTGKARVHKEKKWNFESKVIMEPDIDEPGMMKAEERGKEGDRVQRKARW